MSLSKENVTPLKSEKEPSNMRASVVASQHMQVAAIFDTKKSAQAAIEAVREDTSVALSQLELIESGDRNLSEKLEKNTKTIGRNLWVSHWFLGNLGLITGLVCAFFLTQYGPALTQQNPMFTYIALISPGIFIGLFIAGLLGLRPDRNQIVQTVRHAIRNKKVALVINLKKSQSVKDIESILRPLSNNTVDAIK